MPVLLIVTKPSSDEMYWVSIKDHFSNPSVTSNTIRFNKTSSKFNESSYADLLRLGRDETEGLYLGPIPKQEKLISNLLAVEGMPNRIWVGESKFSRVQRIWPILEAANQTIDNNWLLKSGQIISFQNLTEYPWTNVCDQGTCEDFETDEWALSEDPDKQRHFVELLNRSLTTQLKPEVIRRRDLNCYLFRANLETAPLKVKYQSASKQVPMTVVHKYDNQGSDGKEYVWLRHLAFQSRFKRFDDRWYLEITPTYVFTWDGHKLYLFHEDALSGIKRIEKNRAVLSGVLLWADYLTQGTDDLFRQPIIKFGQLLTFDTDVGIDDEGWSNKYPDDHDDSDEGSDEDQETEDLFAAVNEATDTP